MATTNAYHNKTFLDDSDHKEKQVFEEVEHVDDKNAGLSDAIHAEEQEHMGVLAAFKLYPKATFWSFCVSFVIVRMALCLAKSYKLTGGQ